MIVPDKYPFVPREIGIIYAYDGPWVNEPYFWSWKDQATSYQCAIIRGPTGHLCGYVRVPEWHPAFGKGYDSVSGVEVHGGLTYSNAQGWFGFDCAHAGDLCPVGIMANSPGDTYRDWPYVIGQIESLAAQFKGMEAPLPVALRKAQRSLEDAMIELLGAEKILLAEDPDKAAKIADINQDVGFAHQRLELLFPKAAP